VHITSSTPVAVYALNQYPATTDATNILPASVLGNNYYLFSYMPVKVPFDEDKDEERVDRFDAYGVIATQNTTRVYRNGLLSAALNRGEVYYYTSDTDMTGAYITSDRPTAIFCLNQNTYIPEGYEAADHLFQQLAPVNTWGKNFFAPVSWRGRDIVRIMASQNGTNITQTGGSIRNVQGGQTTLTNLNAGQWVELEISLFNSGCYISADKPVGVCTYLTSTRYNTPAGQSNPSIAWLPPLEQKARSALIAPFIPVGITRLNAHYALVITPTATRNSTTVKTGNGAEQALSGGTWYNNNSAGMSFYSMPLTDETSTYLFTNSEGGLIVMAYGTGRAESYYYPAASAMRSLDAGFYVNDIHYQDLEYETICSQPTHFRAEISGSISTDAGYLRWYINDVEETGATDRLSWSKTLTPGAYRLRMTVRLANNRTTAIEARLTVALINTSINVDNLSICTGTATLNIKNPVQGANYKWYDAAGLTFLDTGTSFTTPVLNNSTGYVVKVEGIACPPNPVAVNVTVSQPPQVAAMEDRYICYGDEITLETIIADGSISWNVPHTTLRPVETADYIVTASRPPCPSVSDTISITVGDSLYIHPHVLPSFKHGQFYKQQLQTNAEAPLFSVISGQLPAGLLMHVVGLISGSAPLGKLQEKNHSFTIQVLDSKGCTTTRSYSWRDELNTPLVFSPNGDDVNDYFMQGCKLVIFDRLGTKIFEGNNGWDGTHNGKPVPNDVYYYILFYIGEDKNEIKRTGSITLLR